MGFWHTDDLIDPKIQAFFKVQPDGVALNAMARICDFLEYTRTMDSRDDASEQPDCYTVAETGHKTKTSRKSLESGSFSRTLPDMFATSSISGGRRGERKQPGPLPNTTSQWESEAPLLRLPGRTGSPS